jgi:hypothetical protein
MIGVAVVFPEPVHYYLCVILPVAGSATFFPDVASSGRQADLRKAYRVLLQGN